MISYARRLTPTVSTESITAPVETFALICSVTERYPSSPRAGLRTTTHSYLFAILKFTSSWTERLPDLIGSEDNNDKAASFAARKMIAYQVLSRQYVIHNGHTTILWIASPGRSASIHFHENRSVVTGYLHHTSISKQKPDDITQISENQSTKRSSTPRSSIMYGQASERIRSMVLAVSS